MYLVDFFGFHNIVYPYRHFRQAVPPQRTYPLLIGCGEFDIPGERKEVERWKSREPQAKVVVFENAGHCVNMDVPRKFNEVMEEFWADHKRCQSNDRQEQPPNSVLATPRMAAFRA